MVYFDWMRHLHLPLWRQLAWTLLHFPLHLTMTLFMEGAAQLIIFWKGAENGANIIAHFENTLSAADSFDDIYPSVANFTKDMLARYTPQYIIQEEVINNALTAISEIDWHAAQEELGPSPTDEEIFSHPAVMEYARQAVGIILTLDNIVYAAYGVDFAEAQAEEATPAAADPELEGLGFTAGVSQRNYTRFQTLFQYAFVCAGSFLILANILYCIARTEKWNTWAIVRTTINFAIGLGIALVALVSSNLAHLENYHATPWILPTILFAYLIVLTMNHLRGLQPIFGFPRFGFLAKRRTEDPELVQQQTELVTSKYDPGEQYAAETGYRDHTAASTESVPGRTHLGQQQGPQGSYYEYSGETGYRPV